jgi:hypothetical protein
MRLLTVLLTCGLVQKEDASGAVPESVETSAQEDAAKDACTR